MNFETINYLQNGTPKQQQAYTTLMQHRIMEKLEKFDPLLVGTIPINIDIQNSDLDIICYVENQNNFIKTVEDAFQAEKAFSIRHLNDRELSAIVVNFFIDDFEIEIFGQAVPTKNQAAYKHMLIEDYLLKKYGEVFRQQIITLKKAGYKTEPAFSLVLGLEGNPYTELLKINID